VVRKPRLDAPSEYRAANRSPLPLRAREASGSWLTELGGNFTARAEAWACRSQREGSGRSLAFPTSPLAIRLGTEILTASSKDTFQFARSSRCSSSEDEAQRSDSSHGVHRVPLHRQTHRVNSRLVETNHRCEVAKLRTRSALVVPPDSDGFLRIVPCEDVAPHNRSWGSLSFRLADESACLPRERTTLRSVSLLQQPPFVTRAETLFTSVRTLSSLCLTYPHRRSCCHARRIVSERPSTSGCCSAGRVRCKSAVLPPLTARCSHGLLADTVGTVLVISTALTRPEAVSEQCFRRTHVRPLSRSEDPSGAVRWASVSSVTAPEGTVERQDCISP
jgi:hypothetical protein